MVVFSIVKSVFGVVAPGTSSEFTPEKQLLEDEYGFGLSFQGRTVSFRDILLELLLMVQKSCNHHLGCIYCKTL